MGRKRTRALALALVVWFVAVVLFDLAALGLASVLPSGTASRVLMVSAIVNPLGAVRTGTLLGIEGTGAFGAASLALFRFTRGRLGRGPRALAVAPLLARGPDGARGAPPAEGGCLGRGCEAAVPDGRGPSRASPSSSAAWASPSLGLVLADEPAALLLPRAAAAARARRRTTGTAGPACACAAAAASRDAVVVGAPLRLEAVLPAVAPPAAPRRAGSRVAPAPEAPLDRPHAPPVPPPKRLLPA